MGSQRTSIIYYIIISAGLSERSEEQLKGWLMVAGRRPLMCQQILHNLLSRVHRESDPLQHLGVKETEKWYEEQLADREKGRKEAATTVYSYK